MSAPRHLWSGDWRDESSALAEELAARRAEGGEAPEAEPDVASPPAAKARPRRPLVRLRRVDPRRLRTVLLVALLTLLVAGGAYAVASGSGGRSADSPAAATGSAAWLGIDMSSSPVGGVMVVGVAPHSPARAAGIKPGDLITQIDTEPIAAPAIVEAAISGLRPGDQVEIELQRGSTTYTTRATLATPPSRNP
ncbi:MAG: PDZ domain-containing protein [Solirubrobacterales bacterium]|nr:PDZ domain-containing protein [Solirubrobacterales bacterium]